jgi:(+)-trans-carveol dehydrogenase
LPGRVEGKVAFITGAARGQGRSHAIRLAEEGADIIAVDLGGQVDSVAYKMDTEQLGPVKEVEALGRRIVTRVVDVRDHAALKAAVDDGVEELGRLDIVCANAGIASWGGDMTEKTWKDMIDINLTGVWNTTRAAVPHLIAGGHGGSIIITSSSAGLKAYPHMSHYVASKHGVVGLMRSLALELGPHMIRVNSIHPGAVDTEMIQNDALYRRLRPDVEEPTQEDTAAHRTALHALPIPWVQPVDISNAVLFLASDEARYITGVTLPIDAGGVIK